MSLEELSALPMSLLETHIAQIATVFQIRYEEISIDTDELGSTKTTRLVVTNEAGVFMTLITF